MFYVSRQSDCFRTIEDGGYMVEVNVGGSDYSNPGELVNKYPGEGKEYADPREAVKVAIAICEAWRNDEPEYAEFISVGYGYTWGSTMPFDPAEFEDAIAWAEERYQELERCDRCGTIIEGDNYYTLEWYVDDSKYCREYCADEAYAFYQADSILLQLDEEEAKDDDEVYCHVEGDLLVLNPAEDEQRGLFYVGDVLDVRRRFKHRYGLGG